MRHAVNTFYFPAYMISLLIPNLIMEGQLKYLPSIIIVFLGLISFSGKLKDILSRWDFRIFVTLFSLMLLFTLFKYSKIESIKVLLLLLHCVFVYLLSTMEDQKILEQLRLVTLILLPVCFIPIFSEDDYLQSIFLYRNDFASFLGIIFFFIDFSWKNKNWKRFLLLMIFIISLFTKSRDTIVLMLTYISIKFFSMYFNRTVNRFKVCLVAFLLISNLSYIYFLEHPEKVVKLNDLMSITLHPDKNLFQLSGRDALYGEVKKISNEYPFGVGAVEAKRRFDTHNMASTPHNIYFKFLAEYGWVFTGLLILALGVFLFSIENPSYLAFYVALLTKGMFESLLPFGISFLTAFLVAPYIAKIKIQVR